MLDAETKRKIDSLRDILVGIIPNPQTQVDHITTGLIYKFLYDMDKESISMGGVASFFVGDYVKYSWEKLFDSKLGGLDLTKLYRDGVESFYLNPNAPHLFRDLFKNATSPTNKPAILKMFLEEINAFEYSNSEILGNAFEYLLSFMGSQGEAGQFRTPRHIIDFIVEIINPGKSDSILDPACGTAGFLISAYKHISKNKLSASEKKKVTENIHGYDITPEMVRLSQVNMYLHNIVSPNIYEYDTLTSEDKWNEYYNVILANPPFMTPKGGIRPHQRFGIISNRSEVLFVDYIIEHLKPEGRAGIVVPEGIIFDSDNTYKKLRKYIVDNGLISVISLPKGIFAPYSDVKTAILILDKKNYKKYSNILFLKIQNDGYELNTQRNPIEKNDLPTAISSINFYLENEDLLLDSSIDSILVKKENIYNQRIVSFVQSIYQFDSEEKLISKYEMLKLDDIVEIESGSRDKGGAKDEGIPSIGGEQISEYGEIKHKKMKYISNEHFAKMKKGRLRYDDVLLVKDGATTGKVCLYKEQLEPAAVNEHVFLLRTKGNVLPYYLYSLIKSDEFQKKLAPYNNGVIGGINLSIKDITIPIPPIKQQEEIVAEILSLQSIVDLCRKVIQLYRPTIIKEASWERFEIGDICEFAYGDGLKESLRISGDFNVFGSNGVIGTHNEYLVEGPFIIVGRKGTAGAVHYSQGNGFPIDTTFFISKNELKTDKILLKFLYVQLMSLRLDENLAEQTVPGLNRNEVYKKFIYIPSIEIQEKVLQGIELELQTIKNNNILIDSYNSKINALLSKIWDISLI